jgi:2-polyprenyl-3-methyl-5-hydroxy-6-metoxy-1,4-benzoquinol methylase
MTATDVNREYYEELTPGREDYWRLMAAPRRRVAVIMRIIAQCSAAALGGGERNAAEGGGATLTSVIELGCGDGRLLREVHARWPSLRLTGIDLSRAQIEANAANDPSIQWLAADLQQPVGDRAESDVVIASEIIEHLDDPEAMLCNARRLGKRLIVTTQSGPIRKTEESVGHRQHFDEASMRAILERTGWSPLRVWNEGFPFHDLSKWAANMNPGGAIRRFGGDRYGAFERFISWALRVAFVFNSRHRGAQLFAVAERGER